MASGIVIAVVVVIIVALLILYFMKRSEASDLTTRINTLTESLTAEQGSLAKVIEEKNSLITELAKSQSVVEALNTKVQDNNVKINEYVVQISALKTELGDNNSKIVAYKDSIVKLTTENAAIKADSIKLNASIAELQAKLNANAVELVTCKAKIESLNQLIKTLNEQIEAYKQNSIAKTECDASINKITDKIAIMQIVQKLLDKDWIGTGDNARRLNRLRCITSLNGKVFLVAIMDSRTEISPAQFNSLSGEIDSYNIDLKFDDGPYVNIIIKGRNLTLTLFMPDDSRKEVYTFQHNAVISNKENTETILYKGKTVPMDVYDPSNLYEKIVLAVMSTGMVSNGEPVGPVPTTVTPVKLQRYDMGTLTVSVANANMTPPSQFFKFPESRNHYRIDFGAVAANDINFSLSPDPRQTPSGYFVTLGGWGNNSSVVRYGDTVTDIKFFDGVRFLRPNDYNDFIIEVDVKNGTLTISGSLTDIIQVTGLTNLGQCGFIGFSNYDTPIKYTYISYVAL